MTARTRSRSPEVSWSAPLGPDGRARGFFVIDRSVYGLAGGGVRVSPSLDVEELTELAATMTRKYAFLNLPLGGAKAGLRLGDDVPSSERRSWLTDLGRRLAPHRGRYFPGVDLGTGPSDLVAFMDGLGTPPPELRPDSGRYTAQTLRVALEELLRCHGETLRGQRVLIEGLGKVGGWVARLVADAGAVVVGVSTLRGSLAVAPGIDVERLLALRELHGSACVRRYADGVMGGPRDLLAVPADVFLPCAHGGSLSLAETSDLSWLVPAANNALTRETRRHLEARGVVCVPDFVSSAGGVLGSAGERLGLSPTAASRLIDTDYRWRVRLLLDESERRDESLHHLARRIARTNLERRRQFRLGHSMSSLVTRLGQRARRRRAPGSWAATAGRRLLGHWLRTGHRPGIVPGLHRHDQSSG